MIDLKTSDLKKKVAVHEIEKILKKLKESSAKEIEATECMFGYTIRCKCFSIRIWEKRKKRRVI